MSCTIYRKIFIFQATYGAQQMHFALLLEYQTCVYVYDNILPVSFSSDANKIFRIRRKQIHHDLTCDKRASSSRVILVVKVARFFENK